LRLLLKAAETPKPNMAAAQRSFFKIGHIERTPEKLFLLLRRIVAKRRVSQPASDPSVIASAAKQPETQARYGLLRFARNDGQNYSRHRLFQFGDAVWRPASTSRN